MKKLLPLAVGMAACLLAAIPATAQSLIGAWTYGDTSSPTSTGTGVFVFLSNGAYFHAESDNTDDGANGMDGVERGTYSYNDGTGTFTFNSNAVNTNGGWGLSDMTPGDTLAIDISGDTFSVDGGGYDFTRVTGSNNLIGAWTFGDSLNPDANGTGGIVFMENLVYFHIETDNTDVDGMNGMERGTYTWNQITGAFSSTQAVDTNGQWGLSDTYSGMLVSVTGNTLNATDTDGPGSGTFSASRVSAVPEPSTYAVMAGALVLGIAILRRRI